MPAHRSTSVFNKFQQKCQGFSGRRLDSPTSPAGPRPLSPFAEKKIQTRFKLLRRSADRAGKSWSRSSSMKNTALEKSAWLAPGLRLILLGLVTLLLLCAPARGQSLWPRENFRKTPDGLRKSGWPPYWCPLPPASVFSLQANLRKYLETWPTPGSTTTEAWPEYVPEDGEGRD